MLKELVMKNRSYRRFHGDHRISRNALEEIIDLARMTASAGNKQPLKYYLSLDSKSNQLIYPHLAWAGYLSDWSGPIESERPSAYIIMLGDSQISPSFRYDDGIAAQTILLAAVERGLGGCIIAAVQRENLRTALNISHRFEILLVIALGKPKETVIIEPIGTDGDIRYWRDQEQKHHVPKRSLREVIVNS
jgi:nitroreductase